MGFVLDLVVGMGSFSEFDAYRGSGEMVPYNSFARIGSAIFVMGFAVRAYAIFKSAIFSETPKNAIESFIKLAFGIILAVVIGSINWTGWLN